MEQYLNIFIDEDRPTFLDKYLTTETLKRLKYVTQFCGCDYTKLYSPLFLYTRFDHSLIVAHMVWHFTHDKRETIAALLHDVGTPCFAHCIDYVFGDYIKQETSEKGIIGLIKKDTKLLSYLKRDGFTLEDFSDLTRYSILENSSPRLCADRLDGVLHTCYIWLHTHTLSAIKEVYDDMAVLQNESGLPEIGFKTRVGAEKFVEMVSNYAIALQSNTDKYVMKYISELVKMGFKRGLINFEDLYTLKEEQLVSILERNFSSWKAFNEATVLKSSDTEPTGHFAVSIDVKKRNTIPLVQTENGVRRIDEVSEYAKKRFSEIEAFKNSKYAFIEEVIDLSPSIKPKERSFRSDKVIFLDFDGVVNDIRNQSVRVEKRYVDEIKKVIAASGAIVVVSSSQEMDSRYIESLVEMGIQIADCLPPLSEDLMEKIKEEDRREKRIILYLNKHPEIKEFVIIEDDFLMKKLHAHQVFIEYSDGFTSRYVEPSLRILNGELGFYPEAYDRSETIEERFVRIFPDKSLRNATENVLTLLPVDDKK